MRGQPGFWDLEERYERLSAVGCQTARNVDPLLECAPEDGQWSGRCFASLPDMLILELLRAQIA